MVRPCLLALSLLLHVACADDPPPRPPAEAPPKKDPPPAPAAGGQTHELKQADSGVERTILVGDRVLVELAGPSAGLAPEYRFAWKEPVVTGEAVRFVNRDQRDPPPDVDGGATIHVFELRAVRTGRSKLTIGVRDKGPKADATPFELSFIVALPD